MDARPKHTHLVVPLGCPRLLHLVFCYTAKHEKNTPEILFHQRNKFIRCPDLYRATQRQRLFSNVHGDAALPTLHCATGDAGHHDGTVIDPNRL